MNKTYRVASPHFSEEDISWIQKRVGKVLKGTLSTGPFVREFEEKFAKKIGSKYAVFLNTCSNALEISLMALGLNNGDEVIVPAETFIASGMSVTLNGGKVVFAEINPNNFCMDLKEIKRRITKKTKGVILVHFGGYMSEDTILIKEYCNKNGLFLIEDAAHAHGSRFGNVMAGAIGDTGCFSFFSTKIMTTGEGGMLTTNNSKIYDIAISLRDRGQSLYSSKELFSLAWRSCRVPEINALLGLRQLKSLDNSLRLRSKIARIYNKAFQDSEDFIGLSSPKHIRNAFWKHITIIKNKKVIRKELAEKLKKEYKVDINWAYSPPIHLQPVYRKMYGTKKGMLPITEKIMNRHFHLPMHVGITETDATFITSSVLKAVEDLKK